MIVLCSKYFVQDCSPDGRRGCGKKEMEFMWMSDFGQFWGADYENLCYTANFRGLQPRFHENASFSAKSVKSFKFKKLFFPFQCMYCGAATI